MKIARITQDNLEQFKDYCRKHRFDHDESFLYEDDLEALTVEENNPGFLLLENNKVIGVLSLVADNYYLTGKRARVRIFHCVKPVYEHYEMLLNALLPTNLPIDKIEMFLPSTLNEVTEIMKKLAFKYYRTSYVMVRIDKEKVNVNFDEGYEIRPFVYGKDEPHYMRIRNSAFKNLLGSETPITLEMVKKQSHDVDLLKDGIKLLWHYDKPIGVIRMLKEEENGKLFSFVAPIAIIPEYQGKGLGVKLLKVGIITGYENNIYDSMLTVNGENDNALKLYKKVGYEVDEEVNCYNLFLKNPRD